LLNNATGNFVETIQLMQLKFLSIPVMMWKTLKLLRSGMNLDILLKWHLGTGFRTVSECTISDFRFSVKKFSF
jgi:hypothetical protein